MGEKLRSSVVSGAPVAMLVMAVSASVLQPTTEDNSNLRSDHNVALPSDQNPAVENGP